jgi:hypothetical protein
LFSSHQETSDMGVFDFFRKRRPAAPPTPPALKWEDFPGAVALAELHEQEGAAERDWMLDRSGASPQPSEGQVARSSRHTAELAAAVSGLSDITTSRFQTVYYQVGLKFTQTRIAKDFPEIIEAQEAAAKFAAAIKRGETVPPLMNDAYERGRRNGRSICLLDDKSKRLALIEDQQTKDSEWLDTLDRDRRVCSYLMSEGSSIGMGEGAREKLKRDKENAPPSLLNKSSFWDTQIATIRFLAGDLGTGNGHLLASGKVRTPGGSTDFSMSSLASVEPASEESVKRVGGALGWGLAGAALLGPAGLIVGGLLGGRGKDVTFVGTLKDGKRFLVTARSVVYVKFQAATFK